MTVEAIATKETLSGAVDLNATISELEKVVRSVFGDRLFLRTRLDPKLGRIKADPREIDRLLVSLVIHAQETASARGELTVSTANRDLDPSAARDMRLSSGAYIQLDVTVGPGRLGALETVGDIVQQNHGAMSVQSSEQHGSTVTILLPRLTEI